MTGLARTPAALISPLSLLWLLTGCGGGSAGERAYGSVMASAPGSPGVTDPYSGSIHLTSPMTCEGPYTDGLTGGYLLEMSCSYRGDRDFGDLTDRVGAYIGFRTDYRGSGAGAVLQHGVDFTFENLSYSQSNCVETAGGNGMCTGGLSYFNSVTPIDGSLILVMRSGAQGTFDGAVQQGASLELVFGQVRIDLPP